MHPIWESVLDSGKTVLISLKRENLTDLSCIFKDRVFDVFKKEEIVYNIILGYNITKKSSSF